MVQARQPSVSSGGFARRSPADSPQYAPLQDLTIELGVRALLGAARTWLADGE